MVAGEGGASRRDDLFKRLEGGDVLVDDGLVDQRPQRLGRLHFRGVGGLEDEPNAVGNDEAGFAVPAGVVERQDDAPLAPGAGFGLDTPFETYQKLSPVAGETNAV